MVLSFWLYTLVVFLVDIVEEKYSIILALSFGLKVMWVFLFLFGLILLICICSLCCKESTISIQSIIAFSLLGFSIIVYK